MNLQPVEYPMSVIVWWTRQIGLLGIQLTSIKTEIFTGFNTGLELRYVARNKYITPKLRRN